MPFSARIKCPVCGSYAAYIVSATTEVDNGWGRTRAGYPVVFRKSEYDLKCFNCDSEVTIRGAFETLENWRRKNAEAETDPDT